MSIRESNIEMTGDWEDQDLGNDTAADTTAESSPSTMEEVLDKHFPPQPQSLSSHTSPTGTVPKPTVDRIVKANQDAISQYDDLKLASYIITEQEGSTSASGAARTNTSNGHVHSNDPEFRQQLQSEDQINYGNGSDDRKNASTISLNYDGLSSDEAERRLQLYGPNSIPKSIVKSKLHLFCTQLFGAPMPIMIWIAIVILLLIGNIFDAIILCIIQFTNATISYYEMTKAGDAVAALQHTLQPTATVKRDGMWHTIPATGLVPGDTILLSSGVNVPADCRINNPSPAYIDVDQSAMTGESLPITFYKNDSCKMGSTVVRGEVEVGWRFVN
jgi:magnesium-transporting ATPase (P-type)